MKVYSVEIINEYDNNEIYKIFLDENKAKKYVDDNNIKFESQSLFDNATKIQIAKIWSRWRYKYSLIAPNTTDVLAKAIGEYIDTLNYPEEIKLTNLQYALYKNKPTEHTLYNELQMYEMEVEE